MSVQKKSLISNRLATKKANVTKVSTAQVSTTKLAKLPVSLVRPLVHSKIRT